MLFHTLSHPFILLVCVCAGIVCGIVYDVLKAVRIAFGNGTVVTVICDLLYGAAVLAVGFAAFFYANDMFIEWYMPPCVAAGTIIYSLGLRKLLLFLQKVLYNIKNKLHGKCGKEHDVGESN